MVINSYKELRVFQSAMAACMDIFQSTKGFPAEERYSLVDQMRRSSRSVCANLAEAWRPRRYQAAFVAKLCDAESEASETQVWLEIAHQCGYFSEQKASGLVTNYDQICGQIVRMVQSPEKWLVRKPVAEQAKDGSSPSPALRLPGSPARSVRG
jgi:four helix bundle protein